MQKYKSEGVKWIKKAGYCYKYYQNLKSGILLKLDFKFLFNDQFILQVLKYLDLYIVLLKMTISSWQKLFWLASPLLPWGFLNDHATFCWVVSGIRHSCCGMRRGKGGCLRHHELAWGCLYPKWCPTQSVMGFSELNWPQVQLPLSPLNSSSSQYSK